MQAAVYAVACALLIPVLAAPGAPRPATASPDGGRLRDADLDGVDDELEDQLAERFAPIVYHGEQESSFPVSVGWWLAHTHLAAVDASSWLGDTRRIISGPLDQPQLLNHTAMMGSVPVSSSGSRSRGKQKSFVLENIPKSSLRAAIQPADWVTYVHSYPNVYGGVTLQYWRAYAWDDARFMGLTLGHGGDWEAMAVHLNAQLQPVRTTFLGHTGIVDGGGSVRWDGTHPLVWSEEGGHSSAPDTRNMRSTRFIRQPSWTGGMVTRWDGATLGVSGGLVNVGEKSHPRNGQLFVKYSGLWGSHGRLFMTSGYWGPAYNETDAECADGRPAYRPYWRRAAESPECGAIFLKAWCDGIKDGTLDRAKECYADADVP